MNITNKLHPLEGTNNEFRYGDVVFIHGLGGNAFSTWHPQGKEESQNSWLQWLGQDIKSVGIWTVSYLAKPFGRENGMPLVDLATNIVALLEDHEIGDRPIIFIAHSMGGLVVKQILRHSNDFGNESWKRILKSTRGIIYLSTPHMGSNLATWSKYIKCILGSSINVKELEAHNSRLRELNEVYRNQEQLSQIPIKAFCESLPTRKVKQIPLELIVVDKDSANPGISGVTPIPLNKDHIDIAKPTAREDRPYLSVRKFIQKNFEINNNTERGILLPTLESHFLNSQHHLEATDLKKKS
ncbi:PGAP1-like protein [Xenococcus sp. PCC 7305]|uniref:esterase/lipase family protein n=1 Tax=Xenococcus sp. PCC 7305 TaxID=102125 RepID=UPI0002ACD290|nr:PGAP1-like protein [Xenococcus sp. PCC 7305]ELS01681.1 PGAP1-like protein [Xenococcus sp. PCC 7305]